MLPLDFSLKNEHHYRIQDLFKKTDKLSVLLKYTSMVLVITLLQSEEDLLLINSNKSQLTFDDDMSGVPSSETTPKNYHML